MVDGDEQDFANDVLDAIGNVISAMGDSVEQIGVLASDTIGQKAGKILGTLGEITGIASKANDGDGFTYDDFVATAGSLVVGSLFAGLR